MSACDCSSPCGLFTVSESVLPVQVHREVLVLVRTTIRNRTANEQKPSPRTTGSTLREASIFLVSKRRIRYCTPLLREPFVQDLQETELEGLQTASQDRVWEQLLTGVHLDK